MRLLTAHTLNAHSSLFIIIILFFTYSLTTSQLTALAEKWLQIRTKMISDVSTLIRDVNAYKLQPAFLYLYQVLFNKEGKPF